MKISLTAIAIFSLICVNAYGQDERKITSTDANDYVDCAAFYASVLASVTIMGNADKEKTGVLKERVNFYLKTAAISSGSGSLTVDMQNRFLTKIRSIHQAHTKCSKIAIMKFTQSMLSQELTSAKTCSTLI